MWFQGVVTSIRSNFISADSVFFYAKRKSNRSVAKITGIRTTENGDEKFYCGREWECL